MKHIDNFLNSITMYRLVLYGLILISLLGVGMSFAGVLPFNWLHMVTSGAVLVAVCAGSNKIFGYIFKVPDNVESSYITAFILFLILPAAGTAAGWALLALAGAAAMASKYVLNIRGKHLFNPAAVAAVLLAVSGMGAATWWVGSGALFVPVAIVGLLMVRKVRWSWLFISFVSVALVSVVVNGLARGADLRDILTTAIWSGPLLFFGSIMLTEPLTTPPTQRRQIIYGALTGALYGTPFNFFGLFYNAPELTLVIANIYSYFASPKGRFRLALKEKIQTAPLLYDFIFTPNEKVRFTAGQYMEWTTWPHNCDSRGNRRFFTIASSPTEDNLRIGVKVPEEASSFKQYLNAMKPGDELVAGHLTGDFTLPRNWDKSGQPIVGIAGGIGVTPFRSIIKNLIDTNQKIDMVLFYAAPDPSEFVYGDVLKQAEKLGVKTVYVLSGAKEVPAGWSGKTGFITEEMVKAEAPNFQTAQFFLSGPNAMVDAYKKLLLSLKVSRQNIRTDYFPGY